jgi:ABC-type multidrug transport system ATPase subunit
MIKVQDVSTKIGGRQILDRVSFEVAAGETVALVGANGAGKTSMLRCLLGIMRYEGSIRIQDILLEKDPVRAKGLVGYMPQVAVFCEQTAGDSLAFIAKLRGVATTEIWPLLERVGLIQDVARPVRVFSTGMRQRLSLAASLIGHPPILILDEPTASLDLKGQVEIIKLLKELKAQGKTILICSHRAEEVKALVDRIVVMDQGRVIASGPVEEVASVVWGDAAEDENASAEYGIFRAKRVK